MNKYTMVMDYTLLSHDFLFSLSNEQPLFNRCWDKLTNNDELINNFKRHFNDVLCLREGDSDPALWSLGYTPEDSQQRYMHNEYVYNAVESCDGLKLDAINVNGESHHVEIKWERTCTGDGIFGEGPYYSYSYRNITIVEDRPIPTDYKAVLHEDFNRRFVEFEYYALKRKR